MTDFAVALFGAGRIGSVHGPQHRGPSRDRAALHRRPDRRSRPTALAPAPARQRVDEAAALSRSRGHRCHRHLLGHEHARRSDREGHRRRQGGVLREADRSRHRAGPLRCSTPSKGPTSRCSSRSTVASIPAWPRCARRGAAGELGEIELVTVISKDPDGGLPIDYLKVVGRHVPRHDHPRFRHGTLPARRGAGLRSGVTTRSMM